MYYYLELLQQRRICNAATNNDGRSQTLVDLHEVSVHGIPPLGVLKTTTMECAQHAALPHLNTFWCIRIACILPPSTAFYCLLLPSTGF